MPPKMPFFVHQKVEISSKNLLQIPNSASFYVIQKWVLSAVPKLLVFTFLFICQNV